MKIAILGAGNVGGALARAYASLGHNIFFGVQDPNAEKNQKLLKSTGQGAKVGTVAEAVNFGKIIVLSLPWGVTQTVLKSIESFKGKLIIDCTLPIAADFSGLTVGHTKSGAEQVESWAKGAKVCKAFGQTGFETMADPKRFEGTPVMFVCGSNPASRSTTVELVNELGFDGIDIGELSVARLLEPYGFLWVHLAYKVGLGRDIAFALLRK